MICWQYWRRRLVLNGCSVRVDLSLPNDTTSLEPRLFGSLCALTSGYRSSGVGLSVHISNRRDCRVSFHVFCLLISAAVSCTAALFTIIVLYLILCNKPKKNCFLLLYNRYSVQVQYISIYIGLLYYVRNELY